MKEIDFSKPLSDEDIAYLEARMPTNLVEHYIAKAKGAEFEGGETKEATESPAKGRTTAKASTAATGDAS